MVLAVELPKKRGPKVKYRDKYHRIQRERMRKSRTRRQRARKELLTVFPEPKIRVQLPTVHELLFGKKPKRRRK